MPSTFTNNGGIELPADGEKDGTWGDVVNLNMQIVDRLTNGVGAISLVGTSHTLTTANGILADGQYGLLVFGGSPSGTNTVTIEPNDAEKIYFVRNATAQSVVMTQGSGGDVTIPAGANAVVYANGAGTGATVADFTANLIPDLTLAGVTASANELNILDGATLSTTELNYVDGVTSAIQTQINAKQATVTGGATTITSSNLTASRALISDAGGKVVVSPVTSVELAALDGLTASTAELNVLDGVTASTAELNYLDGVTAPTGSGALVLGTGATLNTPTLSTPILTTPAINTSVSGTAIASTAEAEAGGVNNKLMTPLRVAEAITAQTPLLNEYASAEQTITSGGTLTLTHGLGSRPKLLSYSLVCKEADQGFSVGDEVDVNGGDSSQPGSSRYDGGFSSILGVSNIDIKYGVATSVFGAIHPSTGLLSGLTNGRWRLIVRAWA